MATRTIKACVNGKIVKTVIEFDEEKEIAEVCKLKFEEASRPLTESEVLTMLLKQQINTIEVDDNTALRMTEFYPEWSAGQAYTAGFKVQYGGTLYKCLNAHTSQDDWAPDLATSLFSRIDEEHSGTREDPIPYYANMEVFSGKYYIEDSVLYKCIRDSGIALQNKAADLVNNYFEVVE